MELAHAGPRLGGSRRGDGIRDVREVCAPPDGGLRIQAGAQRGAGHGDESAGAAEAEGGDAGAVREHAQADQDGQRGGVEKAAGRNRFTAGRNQPIFF